MSPSTAKKSTVVRTLNSLLRSEISAADSYIQAIPRVGGNGSTDTDVLRRIGLEHSHAVQRLRAEIQRVGGTPAETSGAWATISNGLVHGPGQVFVHAAALVALREGETQGLSQYEAALREVHGPTATLIKEALIPAQLEHIESLDAMIGRL